MQHAVRRSARGSDRRDPILQGRARDDLPRPNIFRNQVHHQPPCLLRHNIFVWIKRRDVIGAGRADAEELDRGRHRVRRELAAAGAGARTGALFDLAQLIPGHRAGRHGAHRLEDFLQCDVLSAISTRADRPAVERQSGDVHPDQRHHGGRDRLVAADNHHQPVEEMAADDQLDRIGDHLPAHE